MIKENETRRVMMLIGTKTKGKMMSNDMINILPYVL